MKLKSLITTFIGHQREVLFSMRVRQARINVAHFMAKLTDSDSTWKMWRGQMPVIYKQSLGLTIAIKKGSVGHRGEVSADADLRHQHPLPYFRSVRLWLGVEI